MKKLMHLRERRRIQYERNNKNNFVDIGNFSLYTRWEYVYDGDTLPDDTSLGADAWQLMGDNSLAEVTDQRELHIDDVGTNHCFFLYNIADSALMQQATIEARVKVLSQSGVSFEVLFGMQDGSNSKWLDLFPDHIMLNGAGTTYDVDMTEYHILRMVRDAGDIRIYVDDLEVISEPYVGAGESWIGFIFGAGCTSCTSEQYWDYVAFTTQGSFSPEELPSYATLRDSPDLAYGPKPANGSLFPYTWANLTWTDGLSAVTHDVYLSDNFADVNDGTPGSPGFMGNQAGTSLVVGFPGFAIPDGLAPGTTYYWRVDEVNEADPNSPWKGNVWSFLVPSNIAYAPDPADGAGFVDPNATLNWTAGNDAKLHTFYIGDSYDDVDNATGGPTVTVANYAPDTLETDKTYYWRVDEFDGLTTRKGDVWSFTTQPTIAVHSDPDLVAWWTFDEGEGTTALDWSGHGNHATLVGSRWVTEAALGDTALQIGAYGAIQNLSYAASDLTAVTVTAWIRTIDALTQYIVSFDRDEYYRLEIDGSGGGPGQVGWDVMTSSGQVDYGSVTRVDDGVWHHVCGVFDNGRLTIYIDGVAEPSATGGPTFGSGNTRFGFIGSNSEATVFDGNRAGGSPIGGEVDDIRIYHRALTQEEIVLVMRGDPRLAWAPSPADDSTPDVDSATPLSWSAGNDASSHEVYFGADKDAVKNADTSDTTGVYRGRQDATIFTPAEGVEWGAGPFYWRIDENNADGTVTTGLVWTFTVADFLLVDDFESYTDNDAANEAIWQSWIDGFGVPTNGSRAGNEFPPYAEQTIVNGGVQSMPLFYDNTAGTSDSRVELTLTAPRDWTAHGVGVLSLWFRGYPASVGSFTEGPVGTFTMTAGGADISGGADEFHFAYRTLTGPGTIIARVDSVTDTHAWAKAGVMIRETLDPDSSHAMAFVTPAQGVVFEYRIGTGQSNVGAAGQDAGITAPHWVKLERDVAGFFTASQSTNGSSWTPIGGTISQNIPMASTVYIGLALTSHKTSTTAEAKFSNVTTTGNVGAQWTNQDIGILANAAEPLYVALSNASGTTAVVTSSDANASVMDAWNEWIIDLSEFANQGLNLANIDKIAIGLGTQGNAAAAGGSGTMFIDDITLGRSTP